MKLKEKTGNGTGFVLTLTACFLLIVCGAALLGRRAEPGDTYVITTERRAPEEIGEIQININTASEEELMTLPGIGPVLAAEIVKDREENGRYETAEDLLRVDGIGESKLEGLRDAVTTGGEENEDTGG